MDKSKAIRAILDKLNTAEKATGAVGAERDQYLKALDEVYGDRTKRAAQLGFNAKQDFYHGTPTQSNIDSFDPSKGKNTLGPGRDLGSYFTSNPEIASEYAGKSGQVIPVKINRKGTSAMELDSGEFGFDDVESAKHLLDGKKNVTVKGDKGVPSGYEKNLKGDTVIVKDGSSVRSKNANFDPRFKDSPNIMAATDSPKGVVGKALDLVSLPQRKLLQFAAQKLGRKGDAENSEASSQDIVEALAEKAGIPEDSVLGNIAKSAGVAGLEVFGDPTALIPGAKLSTAMAKLTKGKAVAGALGKLGKNIDVAKGQATVDLLKSKPFNMAEHLRKQGAKVVDAPHVVKARR